MKRLFFLAALAFSLTAPSVFADGPAATNIYHVFFKAVRQSGEPAVGFKVDASVKGKSQPKTMTTNAAGQATYSDLPTPDTKHQLTIVLHYYTGKKDEAREIVYPFILSDATRLKDTQVIPNSSTPDPK